MPAAADRNCFHEGDSALLLDRKGRRYLVTLSSEQVFHSHLGRLSHLKLIEHAVGRDLRIGLYLAKKPVGKYVWGLYMGTFDVRIPANSSEYRRHFSMDVPAGMTLTDLTPHMHYLGKEVEVYATLPNGAHIPLLGS